MMHLGDFAEDTAVRFMWNSNNGSGASITRATNGTISVYKDGGTTQSTAGVTDTEDFDALVGVHLCVIDTSVDAFYVAGSEYAVVLSGATIDGQTVNAVLAHFSIERNSAALALLKNATFGLSALETLVDELESRLTAGRAANLDNLTSAPLTQAQVRAAIGLASANLDTQLGDLPTNAELATALASADDAVLAAIAALNNLAAGAAMTLTAGERNAIAAAVLDLTDAIETGLTLRQAQRLQVAAAAGKVSGAATTAVTIRNVGDTKNRITATVDADGNRTAVATDVS